MKDGPTSWNRIPRIRPQNVQSLFQARLPSPASMPAPFTVYGNGRSYGDVCLTDEGTLLLTRSLDRFIEFDPSTGLLCCQSGVTLEEILALVVPQGWFLSVTPGTRYVTLGGAIANDVHGKNHHIAGSFGHHVKGLELLRSDGQRFYCSEKERGDWFRATVGGLGLTGLIVSAEIQLMRIQSPWMWVESHRFASLAEFWPLNRRIEKDWNYVVAWIDCLATGKARGRGVIYAGMHAPAQAHAPTFNERSRRIPLELPIPLFNPMSLRVFNQLYYRKPVSPAGGLKHYIPFFYPLDAITNWNRIYGKRGFYQYQCVLPSEHAEEATNELLKQISHSRQGSLLAVLKTFGTMPSVGLLSFARAGATLALDFPNYGDRTLRLFQSLDRIVDEAGGALYPAKDARMPAWMFQQGYPGWEAFSQFIDPEFSSHFWKRVTQ